MPVSPKRQLSMKMELESSLIRELNGVFNIIARDAKIAALRNFQLPSNRYNRVFESLLFRHYSKVQDAFTGTVTDMFGSKQEEITEEEKRNNFLFFLIWWRDETAPSVSRLISETTDKTP